LIGGEQARNSRTVIRTRRCLSQRNCQGLWVILVHRQRKRNTSKKRKGATELLTGFTGFLRSCKTPEDLEEVQEDSQGVAASTETVDLDGSNKAAHASSRVEDEFETLAERFAALKKH